MITRCVGESTLSLSLSWWDSHTFNRHTHIHTHPHTHSHTHQYTPTHLPLQTIHGVQASSNPSPDAVIISRSHTGKGADVVSEHLPGKTPVFAGGSGYKSLRVLKVRACVRARARVCVCVCVCV